MAKKRAKTLNLRRAVWFADRPNVDQTLEGLLQDRLTDDGVASGLRISQGDGSILRLSHRESVNGGGIFLHIVSYLPGESAAIVQRAEGSFTAVGEAPPPEGGNYLDNDIFALVWEDYVIVCVGRRFSEKIVGGILRELVEVKSPSKWEDKFDVLPVADRERIEELLRTGVRQVGLDMVFGEDEFQHAARTATAARQFASGFLDLFREDVSEEEHADLKTLQSRVVIRSGKSTTEDAADRLAELAQDIVSERDTGYDIELKNGTKIDADSIRVKKRVSLQKMANTVSRSDVRNQMVQFKAEIDQSGG